VVCRSVAAERAADVMKSPGGESSPIVVLPHQRGFDAESLLRSLMQNEPGAIYR
jgi:hypothetical protein